MRAHRFYGRITGVGTSSGIRLVVGHWVTTPLGSFADVMIEDATGHRTLLAPNDAVAQFITDTYTFDDVHITPVTAGLTADALHVTSAELDLHVALGSRTVLGHLLTLQPRALATQPWWCRTIDPVARVVMSGVRTAGQARTGRREYYGAVDLQAVTAVTGHWQGQELGTLAPVAPPVRFGFGSTPARPAMTTIVTTVVEDS